MLKICMNTFFRFIVNFLHVFLESCFVRILVSARGTHIVNTLHVLDQFVGHFKHLLTVFTRKKLTRCFVFSDVNLQIERLCKSDHTLFALKICLVSEMIRQDVIFDGGVIVAAEVALSAIIPVGLSVELDVQIDLRISRVYRHLHFIIIQIEVLRTLLRMTLLPFRAWSEVLRTVGVFRFGIGRGG